MESQYYIGKTTGVGTFKPESMPFDDYDTMYRALKDYKGKIGINATAEKVLGGWVITSRDTLDRWYQSHLAADDKKLEPYEVAMQIVSANNIIKIEEAIYIYKDNYYQFARDREIESIIFNRNKSLKQRQRKEILESIKLDPDIEHKEVDKDYICFNNGLLRLHDLKLIEHTPKIICTTKIEHNWLEEIPKNYAQTEIMKSIALWTKPTKKDCDNYGLKNLLLEMSGCCFTYDVSMQTAFVINGDKSNGKSAFIQFLQYCLGDKNYSAVDMSELGDRFTKIELMGKLANISDDIADGFLKEKTVSNVKKFITGDTINGEYKGKDVIKFKPYATFIYTCNDIPKTTDIKGAFGRRFVYFPFLHTFDKKDRDMHIYEKLNTEECAEVFIRCAVEAYLKAKERGYFTNTEQTEQLSRQHATETNNVLSWVASRAEDYTESSDDVITSEEYVKLQIHDNKPQPLYEVFKDWCVNTGIYPNSMRNFVEILCREFNLEKKKRPTANLEGKRPIVFWLKEAKKVDKNA